MSFGTLFISHLIGDYLLQNDWIAQNKTSTTWVAMLHAFIHIFVTFWLVMLDQGHAWPWWATLTLFVTHFLIDRFRLAVLFMESVGQKGFLEHMGPWSMIVVDNTIHLCILWVLWILTR